MKKTFLYALIVIALIITAAGSSFAQENLPFQKPPKEILDLVDYQRAPMVRMDSGKEYMYLLYRDTYSSLEQLSQEEMRLGGLRINPVKT